MCSGISEHTAITPLWNVNLSVVMEEKYLLRRTKMIFIIQLG